MAAVAAVAAVAARLSVRMIAADLFLLSLFQHAAPYSSITRAEFVTLIKLHIKAGAPIAGQRRRQQGREQYLRARASRGSLARTRLIGCHLLLPAEAQAKPALTLVSSSDPASLIHDADPRFYFNTAVDAMQKMQPRRFVCDRTLQWRLLEAQARFAWQNEEYESAYGHLKRAVDNVFSKEPRRDMEAEAIELQDQLQELARQMQSKKMAGVALKLYRLVTMHNSCASCQL